MFKIQTMNIEEFRDYCLAKPAVSESIPFSRHSNTLVFKVLDKMFTATNIETFASFSIKCNPDTILDLRADNPSVVEPSYFSKKHWSTVEMDGSVPDDLLREWLDISYDLVVANMTKKAQKELKDLL